MLKVGSKVRRYKEHRDKVRDRSKTSINIKKLKKLKIQKEVEGEEAEEGYLIPTSVFKESIDSESNRTQDRKTITISGGFRTTLRPITSTFLALPIRYDDDDEELGQIYISPRASFPSSDSKDQQGEENDQKGGLDRRTLFLINLPRDTTAELISEMFSEALDLKDPSLIKVCLHESDRSKKRSNGDDQVRYMTLIEREMGPKYDEEDEEMVEGSDLIPKKLKKKIKKKKEKEASRRKEADGEGVPPLFRDLTEKLIYPDQMRRPLARRLLPTAHVQFENMDQLDRMLNLGSKGSLPLRWPCNLSSRDEKLKKTQISWLDSYKAMRKLVRPSIETVKSHTDNWIINFDKGKIPSLPLPNPEDSQIEDEELKVDEKMIEDEEDGEGQWTVVTRGGKHGRSSTTTIPTQTKTNTKSKGPDPYAQSSMSARDDGAAVKVMKRGFAESFKHTDLDDDNDDEDGEETEVGEKNNNKKKRRVGGQLDKSFYKTDLKNLKKNRTNELRKKFLEDRQKLKSSKKHEDS